MFLFQSIHTGSGTHPASNSVCTRIKVATQFRLVLKSSMCGAVSPLPNTPSFGEQLQLYFFHFTFNPKYFLRCFFLGCLTSQPETNFCMAFRFSTQQLRLLAERCGSAGVLLRNLLTESSVMYTSN